MVRAEPAEASTAPRASAWRRRLRGGDPVPLTAWQARWLRTELILCASIMALSFPFLPPLGMVAGLVLALLCGCREGSFLCIVGRLALAPVIAGGLSGLAEAALGGPVWGWRIGLTVAQGPALWAHVCVLRARFRQRRFETSHMPRPVGRPQRALPALADRPGGRALAATPPRPASLTLALPADGALYLALVITLGAEAGAGTLAWLALLALPLVVDAACWAMEWAFLVGRAALAFVLTLWLLAAMLRHPASAAGDMVLGAVTLAVQVLVLAACIHALSRFPRGRRPAGIR